MGMRSFVCRRAFSICRQQKQTTLFDNTKYNMRLYKLGRLGRVHDARNLFDQMPHPDIVSYTSMLSIYINHNDIPSAETLFRAIPPAITNVVAHSAMLHAYAKAGRLDEACEIFHRMPQRNVYSWTALISGLFRHGRVSEAEKLFDEMPDKNVVSWTTVILGYARNGFIQQARAVFDQTPDKNVVAWTAMVKAYIDNCQVDDALDVFNAMPHRNLYSWNIMIQGCFDDRRVHEAVRLFGSMPKRNNVSWTTMVSGLAQTVSAKLARHYFNNMPIKDTAAWNAMITAYADEGLMAEARELFDSMPERDVVSWNALIGGYAKGGLTSEVFKDLILLLRCCSSVRPNECTLTSVLTSCEDNLQGLMQTHALAMRLGVVHDLSLTNALITMYAKCGELGCAQIAFDTCETKDVVSWTAITLAYSTHGFGARAIENFARMLRLGYRPDEVTFVGLLTACSHTGLVSKGRRFFDSMARAYNLEPRAEHYACLVDILGRAGKVEEALNVVLQMPSPVKQDAAVLGALLGACKLHGNDVLLANEIGQRLIHLEPTQSGGYVLLANVFAASGKWEEVAQIRRQMKGKVVSKIPGFSQVYVKGRHHVFYVGDRSHMDFNEINEMLRDKLLPQMQPQLRPSIYDVDVQDHLF